LTLKEYVNDGRHEDEMLHGYLDGLDPDSPEPNANRSHSYRHGFANGRDDRRGDSRASAAALRLMAEEARQKDATQ
jgi:hypothetical protein